jgi:5-methylcytosine-specific restriction endonuclease McrA
LTICTGIGTLISKNWLEWEKRRKRRQVRMARTPRYTKEQLQEAVKNSKSIAKVLTILGLKPAGGNYLGIKQAIKDYGFDSSHFTGKGHATKGAKPSLPLEMYLQRGTKQGSHKLKKKIIEAGLKKHQCEGCGLTTWREKKIPLELHHLDGDQLNNTIENIQLLCPNCHAQTDDYRGRKKSLNHRARLIPKVDNGSKSFSMEEKMPEMDLFDEV